MPRKKGNKTHQYSINVHQTLIKTFLGKSQVLDINNKYKKVTIKIMPPMPTEPGKEKSDTADCFKVMIEGKHKGSVRECSRELVIRYQKMCKVIQGIMKMNMEKHEENKNNDNDNSVDDESGNLELEIIDN